MNVIYKAINHTVNYIAGKLSVLNPLLWVCTSFLHVPCLTQPPSHALTKNSAPHTAAHSSFWTVRIRKKNKYLNGLKVLVLWVLERGLTLVFENHLDVLDFLISHSKDNSSSYLWMALLSPPDIHTKFPTFLPDSYSFNLHPFDYFIFLLTNKLSRIDDKHLSSLQQN